LAREIILDYFQGVEVAEIDELLCLVYNQGILSGLSQVNIILKSKDSSFVYDDECDVVRNVPEYE